MTQPILPPSYQQVFQTLQQVVQGMPKRGLKGQSPEHIETLANCYLQGVTIVAQLRNNPTWQPWLQPYQRLLLKAHTLLYPEKSHDDTSPWQWLWVAFPAQMWRQRYFYLASFLILMVAAIIGFVVVRENFEMASVFIPAGLREKAELDAYLFSSSAQEGMLTAGREWSGFTKLYFAYSLWIHNTKVAFQCFATGFLFGVPTVVSLITNGLMLGALPALFLMGDIVGLGAWLLPHGVPELTAIILAAGVGLRLGFTMLQPGDVPLGRALKTVIKEAMGTVLLCGAMLLWAGIVEAFIRQSEWGTTTRYWIAFASVWPIGLLFVRGFFAHQTKTAQQGVTV